MFEDVAQMEKEIEDFRKNMAASSELVRGISQLTETVRQQQDSFTASADELLQKMDAGIAQANTDHQATLKKLGKRVDDAIAELKKNETMELQAKLEEINRICDSITALQKEYTDKSEALLQGYTRDCERLMDEMKTEISDRQAKLDASLQGTEQAIHTYQADIELKYNNFIGRLEAVDIDRMYREIQDIKRDMRLKAVLSLSLLGVIIVLAVIGLFI